MKKLKRPIVLISAIRQSDGIFARNSKDKAQIIAEYLENIFTPNDIPTDVYLQETDNQESGNITLVKYAAKTRKLPK